MKRKAEVLAGEGIVKKKRRVGDTGRRISSVAVKRRKNLTAALALGVEHKFLDTSRIGASITAPTDSTGGELDPGTVNCINAVAQGDGSSNRDGKEYIIDSVYIYGVVGMAAQADQTVPDLMPAYFIALVLDKQTNAAQLNSEDVFTNAGASANTAPTPMRNLNFAKRFKVLWTHSDQFPPMTISWDGTNIEQTGQQRLFKCFLRNLNIRVLTSGTSANVTDIVDNSLHVIGYTSTTSPALTISYNARIRFRG